MMEKLNFIMNIEQIKSVFRRVIDNPKIGECLGDFYILEHALNALESMREIPKVRKLMHQTLGRIYDLHVSNGNRVNTAAQFSPAVVYIQRYLENMWESENQKRTECQLQRIDFPSIKNFGRWYKDLLRTHKASRHPLFEYLEKEASLEEMTYFFSQEITVDGRFDDLLAMLQIGQTAEIKMEIAANYWDEMGNGNPQKVHTELFSVLLEELRLTEDTDFYTLFEDAAPESLACGNLLIYYAIHRTNVTVGLGAMGAVEMLAPIRFSHFVKGFKRLGLSQQASEYHKLHITVDTQHGNGWINNAIVPLVQQKPELKRDISYGALCRLESSVDYLDMIYSKFKGKEILTDFNSMRSGS